MPSWSIPLRAHPFPHLSGTGLERSSGEEGSGRGQHAKEQKGTHGCVIRRNRPRVMCRFSVLAGDGGLVHRASVARNVTMAPAESAVRRPTLRTNLVVEGHYARRNERTPLHPSTPTNNRDHEGPVLLAHRHWRLPSHGSARCSSRIRLRRSATDCSNRGKTTRTRHIMSVFIRINTTVPSRINTTVPRCIAAAKNKKEEEQQPKQ